MVDQAAVEIISAEMGVTGGRAHLDHPVTDVEDADVECPAAEIEDHDSLAVLLIQAVGERGGGRLVDDAQDFEPGDPPCVLGGLALRVVKVRRHGDDRLGDLFPEELRRVLDQLAEDKGRDLLRRILLALDLEAGSVVWAGYYIERDRGLFVGYFVEVPVDESFG